MSANAPKADSGSFRDSANRVYHTADGRILRGINRQTADNYHLLAQQDFFQQWRADGRIIATDVCAADDGDAAAITEAGWAAVLHHTAVPFISYPYEWTFSMLQDAALLQLELQQTAMTNGWTFKDATPYNIQWRGAKPVFIDIPSVVPAAEVQPWAASRQFCLLYVYPLLLKAHLDIDFNPLLRADLDGISPAQAAAFFRGWRRFLPAIFSHVVMPATVEATIARRERDRAPATKRIGKPQSESVRFGLLHTLNNATRRLRPKTKHSDWSHYAKTHSYEKADVQTKRDFVEQWVQAKQRRLIWDLGANTGDFSRLCAPYADTVIAVDGDGNAVEALYQTAKNNADGNILPLVMNLANRSPAQGWAGAERAAFDERRRPDFVLCLALVHHLRIAANIPMPLLLDWLRRLNADVVIEFVGRDDEMTQKLLLNKDERYDDYTLAEFERAVKQRFVVRAAAEIKDGKRKLYYLEPAD